MGLYHGDNLAVMRGMEAGSVDLIYADPPFCTGRDFGAFDDRWQDDGGDGIAAVARCYHSPAMAGYLAFMEPRLRECRRVMRDTGSIYLHCDWRACHYLRMLMDDVFGVKRFQNEFVWYYSGGSANPMRWARKHDAILFYSKTRRWTFNRDAVLSEHKWTNGQLRANGTRRNVLGKHPDDVWRHHSLMPWGKERTAHPTQKPLALLDRIIRASSNVGDVVLDPFCGSGTTLVAAQSLGRRWIGIDRNRDACEIAAGRLSTMFETVEVQAA